MLRTIMILFLSIYFALNAVAVRGQERTVRQVHNNLRLPMGGSISADGTRYWSPDHLWMISIKFSEIHVTLDFSFGRSY